MYIERFYYKSGIYYYNRINGFDPWPKFKHYLKWCLNKPLPSAKADSWPV
jgi:hypothetical protein